MRIDVAGGAPGYSRVLGTTAFGIDALLHSSRAVAPPPLS